MKANSEVSGGCQSEIPLCYTWLYRNNLAQNLIIILKNPPEVSSFLISSTILSLFYIRLYSLGFIELACCSPAYCYAQARKYSL